MSESDPHLFEDERAGSIYRTAARIIYEKGFDATSMSEIADALGMTKPGLYYYVKGKKELLYSLMCFAMDRLDAEVVRPATEIGDPAERLRSIVSCHARLLTSEREAGVLAILMDEVGGLSEEQRQTIVRRKRAYFELVRDTIDDLALPGDVPTVDPTVAAFSLLGMVMWLSRWYDRSGALSRDKVVAHLTEIALSAVGHGGTRPDFAAVGAANPLARSA